MEKYSKTFSVDEIPDLSDKVIIITGGATGIGREAALQLYRHNAKIYIASRSRGKFDELVKEIENSSDRAESSTSSGRFDFLQLDLSDITSCKTAAKKFLSLEKRLDVFIANAALSVAPCTLSKDGVEIQFATNHLGHFVFIHSILDLIKETSLKFHEARIVVVASHSHSMFMPTPPNLIDFEDLKVKFTDKLESLADVQASLQRYARSKLANILYTRTLSTHLQEAGYSNIYVNCLNPGTVGVSSSTESAVLPPWLSFISSSIVNLVKIPAASGALNILFLATDPVVVVKGLKGRYFDVGPLAGKFWYGYSWDATEKLSVVATDVELGKRLWEWSLGMMGGVEG